MILLLLEHVVGIFVDDDEVTLPMRDIILEDCHIRKE